jgi:hypothetical protein
MEDSSLCFFSCLFVFVKNYETKSIKPFLIAEIGATGACCLNNEAAATPGPGLAVWTRPRCVSWTRPRPRSRQPRGGAAWPASSRCRWRRLPAFASAWPRVASCSGAGLKISWKKVCGGSGSGIRSFFTPGSEISFSGSRITDPGSRIPDLGSQISDPGSRIQDLGPRILDLRFLIRIRTRNTAHTGTHIFILELSDNLAGKSTIILCQFSSVPVQK